jgi:hypothetical protein
MMSVKRFLLTTAIMVGVVQVSAQPSPLDYSYCGYRMSEQPLPMARMEVYVPWKDGDNAARIQKAIDYVSALRPDKTTGLRGAVVLENGTYELSKPLRIAVSGVVLRGVEKQKTVLKKTGVDRGALLYIEGHDDRMGLDTLSVSTAYVPLNSKQLTVNGTLSVGDRIMIYRPSTEKWINALGCATFGGGADLGYFGWHPGEIDICWDRQVESATGNNITLDAPLSMTLDSKYADTKVIRYRWDGRIENCGVENLTLVSDYDKTLPQDENHCWDGVYMANARNCWVRMVDFRHFAGSAVVIQQTGSQITVEDCISREPVSEIGGLRRRTFFVLGEKCLFQRCYSEQGINDFAAGQCAAGPNAFVQCDSYESQGFSGSVGSWATGLLFDNVNIDGNDLKMTNLRIDKFGAGWNTANSLAYQSTAAGIFCDSISPDATNYTYGCWAQFTGTGSFAQSNNHVQPRSIFADLLEKRLGRDVSAQCRTLMRSTKASTSPTIEEAMQFAAEARQPRVTLDMWINRAELAAPMDFKKAKNVDRLKDSKTTQPSAQTPSFAIIGGKMVADGKLLVGGRHNTPWWSGKTRYNYLPKASYAVTRFVPGQEGHGLTDRIDSVVLRMTREHTLWYNQNYGLWYDRRRDDHERIRRRDGDTWAPYYEQPFMRSGKDKAWDGLSKYDLTRLNPWYFARLNEFADKGAKHGILLVNQHYFQHNILEAGAHWVDTPWRTANNVNDTQFPEPVPFTGDKRIFMAEYFYDITHPVRRELHKHYIMSSLDALADKPNVVHSIGEEFTGPLHFVKFWLDTVREWEAKTGKHATIALSTTKDVQDAVMADKRYADVVDIIDIEQWYYHNKGLYAPEGGVNMAPRQYARKIKSGSARFEDVYRGVSEYREAYPDKAVVYYAQKYPEMAWAVLMAGGSCPAIHVDDAGFLESVATMNPRKDVKGVYVMDNDRNDMLIYAEGLSAKVSIPAISGVYEISKIDKKSGDVKLVSNKTTLKDSYLVDGNGIFWLRKVK